MRHFRRLGVVLGIIVALLVLLLAFGAGTSESRYRKIAADLIALHRQWETNDNIPALFQSLTNLPFQDGAAGSEKAWVYRRYSVLGVRWEEYYFIQRPMPVTNTSKWTLYHAWYWNRPTGGQKELAMHELLTITTN
jgi:hypothetical protein